MPKRIDVNGCISVRADELTIATPEKDVWVDRAATELSGFLEKLTGTSPKLAEGHVEKGKTAIYLLPPRATMFNGLFEHPFFDDFAFYPGFQSYRIAPLPHKHGIVVQGLVREGVYWGVKTLKQILSAEGECLCLPRLLVADGADMEERGIWSQPFGTTSPHADPDKSLSHYKGWLDWMSDHKMNLVEIGAVGFTDGICFRSRRHPEFETPETADQEFLLRELMRYGEKRGMKMIPAFCHPEHYGFIGRKFPELVPDNCVRHHGHEVKLGVNFFHDKTGQVLLDLAEELMEALTPGGLCFWLPENRLHSLVVNERNGRSEFMQESALYYDIVGKLRTNSPDLECRILLSQGSFPENLSLMRAFPPDVKWIYYSGERFGTYNIREKNPIHRNIAAGVAEGRWVSLCNSLRGIPGRPTHLEAIHRNIGHAIKAGLKGLDGMSYAFPGDKLALTVAAEHSWNCSGRSFSDTLHIAAGEAGATDMAAQAKAYALYDSANFAQAVRNSQGVGQPFGNFSRFSNMLERIRTNAPVDELIMIVADNMETDDLPALAKAAEDVEIAIALADTKADPLFLLRCRYLLCIIRVTQAIARAFYINCREKSWDIHKGQWEDYRCELDSLITMVKTEAGQGQSLYEKLVRMEGWAIKTSQSGDPLLKTAALAGEINVPEITSSRD